MSARHSGQVNSGTGSGVCSAATVRFRPTSRTTLGGPIGAADVGRAREGSRMAVGSRAGGGGKKSGSGRAELAGRTSGLYS